MTRGLAAAMIAVGLAGCRGDAAPAGTGSGSAAPVVLRARPAAVVEITLKALGIT